MVDEGSVACAVATAVRCVPGVARLHPGPGGEAAIPHAGEEVTGVELGDGRLVVHVVLDRLPVGGVGEQVREAAGTMLRAVGRSLPVEVVVEDVDEHAFAGWAAGGKEPR